MLTSLMVSICLRALLGDKNEDIMTLDHCKKGMQECLCDKTKKPGEGKMYCLGLNYNIDKCRLDVEKMADEDIKPLVTDWDESLVSRELDARKSVTGTQEDFAGESTAQIREDLDLEPARESDFDVPDNVEYPEPPPPQPRRQEEEEEVQAEEEKRVKDVLDDLASMGKMRLKMEEIKKRLESVAEIVLSKGNETVGQIQKYASGLTITGKQLAIVVLTLMSVCLVAVLGTCTGLFHTSRQMRKNRAEAADRRDVERGEGSGNSSLVDHHDEQDPPPPPAGGGGAQAGATGVANETAQL